MVSSANFSPARINRSQQELQYSWPAPPIENARVGGTETGTGGVGALGHLLLEIHCYGNPYNNQFFWACENENPQETIVSMKQFRNLVCRTSNGNIILKTHPLVLFGDKAKVEKALRDFESFFQLKMTQNDGLP